MNFKNNLLALMCGLCNTIKQIVWKFLVVSTLREKALFMLLMIQFMTLKTKFIPQMIFFHFMEKKKIFFIQTMKHFPLVLTNFINQSLVCVAATAYKSEPKVVLFLLPYCY